MTVIAIKEGRMMEARDDYKCICGLSEEHTADCATYNSGREAGIKEVVDSEIHINFACGTYTIQKLLNMSNEGKIQLKEWGLLRQEMPK